MQPYFTVINISGFTHYKRAEYMEAIPVLMETLRSPGPITPRLKAQLYYLAGQCFTKLVGCCVSWSHLTHISIRFSPFLKNV